MYFGQVEATAKEFNSVPTPTVPGLALAIGFNTVGEVTRALKDWQSGDAKYPLESIRLILRSLTRIEDMCLTYGLQGKLPPALVKFVASAYHDVVEKRQVEPTPGNAIQIIFEAPPELSTGPAFKISTNQPELIQHSEN